MVNLANELANDFTEITPMEFYRVIFKEGFLDKKDAFTKGKYVGIGIVMNPVEEQIGEELEQWMEGKNVIITDELDGIERLLQSDKFCMIAPLAYVGKRSTTENVSAMFAFAIEIDNLKNDDENHQYGYRSMLSQMNIVEYKLIPKPNYIVASGNGLHLYYVFEEPLLLHDSTKRRLKDFKKLLTKKLWNQYITDAFDPEHIQQESAFQKFRIAGGLTKDGEKTGSNERTRVFRTDKEELWTLDKLEEYVDMPKYLTWKEAQKKYPLWAEKIESEDRHNRKPYYCPKGLYYAMKEKFVQSAVVGKRYYCMWGIVVYAVKCNIDYEELKKDCKEIRKIFNNMSDNPKDAFTTKDMRSALKAYHNPRTLRITAETIRERTGIKSTPVKRNHRTQQEHLQAEYWINEKGRKIKNPVKQNRESVLEEMRLNGEITGRPRGSGSKQEQITQWRMQNPIGRKIDCHRETGISRPTIDRWWDTFDRVEEVMNQPIGNIKELDVDAQFEAWLKVFEQEQKASEARE